MVAVCSGTPLMRLTRDERRVIVADLAEQGMSTRAIAPVVGASHMSVARDLAGAPVTDVTPAPVPTFDPAPFEVDHETGEVYQAPQPSKVVGHNLRVPWQDRLNLEGCAVGAPPGRL